MSLKTWAPAANVFDVCPGAGDLSSRRKPPPPRWGRRRRVSGLQIRRGGEGSAGGALDVVPHVQAVADEEGVGAGAGQAELVSLRPAWTIDGANSDQKNGRKFFPPALPQRAFAQADIYGISYPVEICKWILAKRLYSSNSLESGTFKASAIANSLSMETPNARVGLSIFARYDQEIPTLSAKAS